VFVNTWITAQNAATEGRGQFGNFAADPSTAQYPHGFLVEEMAHGPLPLSLADGSVAGMEMPEQAENHPHCQFGNRDGRRVRRVGYLCPQFFSRGQINRVQANAAPGNYAKTGTIFQDPAGQRFNARYHAGWLVFGN
jgi:hypothetical protein